jgi:hypothetical protein
MSSIYQFHTFRANPAGQGTTPAKRKSWPNLFKGSDQLFQ